MVLGCHIQPLYLRTKLISIWVRVRLEILFSDRVIFTETTLRNVDTKDNQIKIIINRQVQSIVLMAWQLIPLTFRTDKWLQIIQTKTKKARFPHQLTNRISWKTSPWSYAGFRHCSWWSMLNLHTRRSTGHSSTLMSCSFPMNHRWPRFHSQAQILLFYNILCKIWIFIDIISRKRMIFTLETQTNYIFNLI